MRLTDLLEAEVRTEDGAALGRVHDLWVRRLKRRSPDGYELRVVGLVLGGRGIRERFGTRTARREAPIADAELIEWERVVEVDGDAGTVLVRGE